MNIVPQAASSRDVPWETGGLAVEFYLIVLLDRGVFEANIKISSLLFLWPWERRELGGKGVLLLKKLGNSLDFLISSQPSGKKYFKVVELSSPWHMSILSGQITLLDHSGHGIPCFGVVGTFKKATSNRGCVHCFSYEILQTMVVDLLHLSRIIPESPQERQ